MARRVGWLLLCAGAVYDEDVARVETGTSGEVRWTIATAEPRSGRSLGIDRLMGYEERTDGPFERSELPGPSVVIIIELGPPLSIEGADTVRGQRRGGFIAGAGAGPILTAHRGFQCGIQLDMQPSVAHRLLGRTMSELGKGVVTLEDVAGTRDLTPRLTELESWQARLALVQQWLAAGLQNGGKSTRRDIAWAERQLASPDPMALSDLRRELHMSERHFIQLFKQQVGVGPKRYARLARFERIRQAMRSHPAAPLSQIALAVGCYDQAHLARETRAFARMSPTELRCFLTR